MSIVHMGSYQPIPTLTLKRALQFPWRRRSLLCKKKLTPILKIELEYSNGA